MIISVEFDTKTKKGKVVVGGETLDNIESLSMYNMTYSDDSEKEFAMELRSVVRNDDEGMRAITYIQASDNGVIKTTNKELSEELKTSIANILID